MLPCKKNRLVMKRYVKKPIVVEANQFTGNNEIKDIEMNWLVDWINAESNKIISSHNGTSIFINTLEGEMRAECGDWIIKGVNGEFYPCKPDVFEKTYDVVEDSVRLQTFGEKAVGITFNPSGSDEVHEAKMLAAKQIDLLEKVHIKLTNDSANTTWVRNVLRTQAFNLLVSAQMALVKYLTWKD